MSEIIYGAASGVAHLKGIKDKLNSTSNPISVGTADQLNVTGSASTVSDIFSTACSQYRSITFQLTGTWAGTVTFQVSNDNTNWVNTRAQNAGDLSGPYIATTTANGVFIAQLPGYQFFRLRFTTATSGTVNANAFFSREQLQQPSVPTNPTAPTNTIVASTTSSGVTVYTLNSAATTNATSIKTSGANLYSIVANNASATTKYVRLFNKASAPTMGTDIPVLVFAVPATNTKEFTFTPAARLATGLAIAITSGAAATDNTAVAAGDVQLYITYA